MIVVTGCEEKYFPGVKALHNSIKANTPEGELDLYCLVYGNDALVKKVQDCGIKTIKNPQFPAGTKFPIGGMWEGREEDMPVMYCRMLIPELFPNEKRVMWLDADTIVMRSIIDLETMDFGKYSIGMPVARKTIKFEKPCRMFNSGVMMFDVPRWRSSDMTERYIWLMNNWPEDKDVKGVVETLLNELLRGEGFEIPLTFHVNGKKKRTDKHTRILHFTCVKPWDHYDVSTKAQHVQRVIHQNWEKYR